MKHFSDIIYHIWVGLTEEGEKGNWTFTDGTTIPEGVTFARQNGRGYQKCAFLYPDGLDDDECTTKFKYACMTNGKYR